MTKYDTPLKRLGALAEGEHAMSDLTDTGAKLLLEDLRKALKCLDAFCDFRRLKVERVGGYNSPTSKKIHIHKMRVASDRLEEAFEALLCDEPEEDVPPECVQIVSVRADQLNALLSKAYGDGFIWELKILEKLDWGLVSTPVLDISLFTDVTRGGNDIKRRWSSEEKTVDEINKARVNLNEATSIAVAAGYVVRLESVPDPRPGAEAVKVTVLKKH